MEAIFTTTYQPDLDRKLLRWVSQQPIAVFLHSNRQSTGQSEPDGWDILAAVGTPSRTLVVEAGEQALRQLAVFLAKNKEQWVFSSLAYDLKNEVEHLHSTHPNTGQWPDLIAFVPQWVIGVRGGKVEIWTETLTEAQQCWADIEQQQMDGETVTSVSVQLQPRISKADYCATVERLRQHIIEGDLYEINFCQEFFAHSADLTPEHTFLRLQTIAQAPFTAFFRWNDHYILSASPERFLRRNGQRLMSQPIKGTRRRLSDPVADAQISAELANSPKDRAENVMIVDLVRNDLARCCRPGTVRVDELFGIYSFPTVHQMISTVSGELLPNRSFIDILKATFPMGSMTGAPKVMAMQIAEQYESHRRGMYSGALGYIEPNGNFDFNVLIRSVLYHQRNGYISASVGGAIVFDSVPEQEYEECMVKLAAMQRALYS
jgi:para-aminobenzoate synthetase component I